MILGKAQIHENIFVYSCYTNGDNNVIIFNS